MKLTEILAESTYEIGVGETNNSWFVRNRFTGKIIAKDLTQHEAERIADNENAEDNNKQRDFYSHNKGGMMGDVHLDDFNK